MRFRVLNNDHAQANTNGGDDNYWAGDIVDSDDDLVAKFPNGFELVDGATPVSQPRTNAEIFNRKTV